MKKNTIITTIAMVALLIMLVSATYAYFAAQGGDAVTRDVEVLTHTVDTLTFSISDDIEIEASQFDFAFGGQNKSGSATVTAILSPNSKTGEATEHYNMYLNITENGIVSTEDGSPLTYKSLPEYDHETSTVDSLINLLRSYSAIYDFSGNTYTQEIKDVVYNILRSLSFFDAFMGCEYSVADQHHSAADNICIWDFNGYDFYNTVSPIYVETDAETGDTRIYIVGGVTDELINTLKAAGWFDLIEPDLMLQVFDDNNNLVNLDGLGSKKTIKGVTGYNITDRTGLIPLLINKEITANNNTQNDETYEVVVTLINKDINQNVNTNKEFTANLIVQKNIINNNFTGTIYRQNNNHTNTGINYLTGGTINNEEYDGVGFYYTSPWALRWERNIYFKHVISNNIIQSSEICLFYRDTELCIDDDYWVGEATAENSLAMKNKLESDINSTFRNINVSCNYTYYGYCSCRFDDFDINISHDGYYNIYDKSISCYNGHSTHCFDN